MQDSHTTDTKTAFNAGEPSRRLYREDILGQQVNRNSHTEPQQANYWTREEMEAYANTYGGTFSYKAVKGEVQDVHYHPPEHLTPVHTST